MCDANILITFLCVISSLVIIIAILVNQVVKLKVISRDRHILKTILRRMYQTLDKKDDRIILDEIQMIYTNSNTIHITALLHRIESKLTHLDYYEAPLRVEDFCKQLRKDLVDIPRRQ